MTPEQEKIVALAKQLIGTLYKYGAKPEDVPNAFDCSSFTQYLFRQVDIELPRSTISQAEFGIETHADSLLPGDLLFFHGSQGFYNPKFPAGIGHVILYIGEGKTIHAASERTQDKPVPIEVGKVEEQEFSYVLEKYKPLIVIKRNLNV